MILIIDNYDSFTYNVYQYLLELSQDVEVLRNDSLSIEEIELMEPSHIIISPGPGRPENAGISEKVIKKFSGIIPILGICLGHQAIANVFGGEIINAKKLMHGKVSKIDHRDVGLFFELPQHFDATRYHSLVVNSKNLPDSLEVTAVSEDDEIMGIRHKKFLTEGVQFHPESILTKEGKNIFTNFLKLSYKNKSHCESIKFAIQEVVDGRDLQPSVAAEVMTEIMDGRATDAQIASLITALKIKGESVDEITAFAVIMRDRARVVKSKYENLIDTCGTGGDSSGSFNISTASAIVVAAAGLPVAKHGNRSISSRSGSADLLESLNVNIDLKPFEVGKSIDEIGIGFLFAPHLHPAMKNAMPARRETAIRTIFNILGPLTNPAFATYQVMGVYDQNLVEKIAIVLKKLGIKRGYVVASDDGMDEVSISSETLISEIKEDNVVTRKFHPSEVGYYLRTIEEVKGGSSSENSVIIKSILNGEQGAPREIVALNAGFAISAGMNISIEEGVRMAEKVIDSGEAKDKLEKLIEFSNKI